MGVQPRNQRTHLFVESDWWKRDPFVEKFHKIKSHFVVFLPSKCHPFVGITKKNAQFPKFCWSFSAFSYTRSGASGIYFRRDSISQTFWSEKKHAEYILFVSAKLAIAKLLCIYFTFVHLLKQSFWWQNKWIFWCLKRN